MPKNDALPLQAANFFIMCRGRNASGGEVLPEPTQAEVSVRVLEGRKTLSASVTCSYNTGGRDQRCNAPHHGRDVISNGVPCPYAFDLS